jgi:cyclophilin family peptidyl-prolyl cis-trans isomerase
MKSKTAVAVISMAIVMVLSGCGNQTSNISNSQPKSMDQNKNSGALGTNEVSQNAVANSSSDENTATEKTAADYISKYNAAEIDTNFGNMKVKFYSAGAPITVNNFLKLADQKFYDGTKFHRVIKGFMIQGGDPNSKQGDPSTWGTGGPGYAFNDELKGTEKYPQGTLAMANSGPNTNGSQFFIVTAAPEAPLPPSYTVFGTVVSGLDVALKIENVKTVAPGQLDRPAEDVIIRNITPLNIQ